MKEGLLLFEIAVRNLFASFLNIIIGGIILVGTFLFVVGGSILDSMDVAMSRSIIGSIAGHLQVYSDKSKEELALIGNFVFPDIAAIPDFSKVKKELLAVDNVQAVVPMGVNSATVMYGNTVDTVLEKLRAQVRTRLDAHQDLKTESIESLKSHVRQIAAVIRNDYTKMSKVVKEQSIDPQNAADLAQANSADFWDTFDADPYSHLEFLENKIAYLVPDADFIALNYAGTDLDQFKASFDRMVIADGEMVPRGHRGMLLSKYLYEHQFKLRIATRLDDIHEGLHDEKRTIAADPDLQHLIKQNRTQTREIILQLDPIRTKQAVAFLQKELDSQEAELPKLLNAFFNTTDENFDERYDAFYKNLVPLLQLYRVQPGDSITIKTFTKTGFMQAANIKVYGTFMFKGMEKSGLAGAICLMDLMSFRDLYGYVTPDKIAEVKDLEKNAGAAIVDKDKAEAELFGGGANTFGEAKEATIDDKAELGDGKLRQEAEEVANRVYTQEEIDGGVALNAAIILKDPTLVDTTTAAIVAASKAQNLDLRTASWQKAAGMLGQFVNVAKAVLYFAVFIIFVVALAVINNAVMMATLHRIREIGTMRAIGAQRTFVLAMVIAETVLLGVVFGGTGAFLGSVAVHWIGQVGIPASNQFMYFFFSGPRLFPTLAVGNLIAAFSVILFVTCVSALYPALVATRVSPIQAMQSED